MKWVGWSGCAKALRWGKPVEEYTCLEGLVDTPLPLAEGMCAYEEPSITETADDGLPLWARLLGDQLSWLKDR